MNTQPRLIALCSPVMGSGKSTLALHLVERHGFIRVAFAASLKRMITTLLLASGFHELQVDRYVSGDMKEQPLAWLPPFAPCYADVMLREIELPAEVQMATWQLRDSLLAWGQKYFRPGVTSRRLQQTIGTEWGRDSIHPDLWRLMARDRIRFLRDHEFPVVIDDMRFPNELDMVEQEAGEPWRVCRPGLELVGGSHASEGQLDDIAMREIWNQSDVPTFLAEADRLLFA